MYKHTQYIECILHESLKSTVHSARRDKYQPDIILYWVEKEVTGSYEKEVRKDHTRSLRMDMGDEGWDDNTKFGSIEFDSEESEQSENSQSDGDDTTATARPKDDRKRKSDASAKSLEIPERTSRRRSFEREDPLEAGVSYDGCGIYNTYSIIINDEKTQNTCPEDIENTEPMLENILRTIAQLSDMAPKLKHLRTEAGTRSLRLICSKDHSYEDFT